MMNPEYLEDGVRFKLSANGEDLQVTEVIRRDSSSSVRGIASSSSGGCESAGGIAGLALIGVMMMSRKRK